MSLMLDENVSPSLVSLLGQAGIPARHVVHAGLSGLRDDALFALALEHDEVVVTVNAEDFIVLARRSALHAGLIVLRGGELHPQEQWTWLCAGLAALQSRPHCLNLLVDVRSPTDVALVELP